MPTQTALEAHPRSQACLQTAEMHAAALAEDPSVFDYDGVFEDLQAKKEKPKAAEPAARRLR